MPCYSVMLAQFPYGNMTRIEPVMYFGRLMAQLENDPAISRVTLWYSGDTPVTMTRNQCVLKAESEGVDFLFMLDSDNHPDYYVGIDPQAKPFWSSSLEFLLRQPFPSLVAAPYCGGPPHEGVHAFRWVNHESDNSNPDFALKALTRHEATLLRGILPCAAAATGVMLIDMRGMKAMPHPRFYYEWKDESESQKASTEDVAFVRDWCFRGNRAFINWDSWAVHYKVKSVGKPHRVSLGSINRAMREEAKMAVKFGYADNVPEKEPPRRIRAVNTYSQLPPGVDAKTVYPAHAPCVISPEEAARYRNGDGDGAGDVADPKPLDGAAALAGVEGGDARHD